MKLPRRRFLFACASIAVAPLLPAARARAGGSPLNALIDQVTGGAKVNTGRVKLALPRLADNGHSVPLKVSVESAMTPGDHVQAITLLSERNPRPIMATFHFNARSARAEVATRVRLNGSQRVVALARLSDGSYWSGSAEVEVTESACLDAT